MRRLILLLLAALLLASCSSPKTNWSVSLDAEKTTPYGAKLLAGSLPQWFGEARVERLPSGFRYHELHHALQSGAGKRSLLLLFGVDFLVSDGEWDALQGWAAGGNDVVIFAAGWDPDVLRSLRLRKVSSVPDEEMPLDTAAHEALNGQAVWLASAPRERFTHRGRSLLGSFQQHTAADTTPPGNDSYEIQDPQPIGFGSKGLTSLRYPIGDGSITVHTAPLVLSNYFLLQGSNRRYLDGFWQAVAPAPLGAVYWQDYYKRRSEGSGWGLLWRHPATRWALLLALLTALLYALFESKRRQRIVPIVKPPENTSVLFVETVGRLYFSQGNHQNLAEKMVQQALDTIRTKYRLATETLDASLAQALAQKTGLPEPQLHEAIRLCDAVRSGTLPVTETDLHHLHQTLRPLLR